MFPSFEVNRGSLFLNDNAKGNHQTLIIHVSKISDSVVETALVFPRMLSVAFFKAPTKCVIPVAWSANNL